MERWYEAFLSLSLVRPGRVAMAISLIILPKSIVLPAVMNSSRQRYSVFSETPYRRASTPAGSSRRNSDSTASRCSDTFNFDFGPIGKLLSISMNTTT